MSASEWQFGVAVEPEDVRAPRCDGTLPADKRVTDHWVNDKTELEYRTAESPDAWMRTDTPVLSLNNWR